ncbi:MAG: TetR/AcrR family transcriptional regulator [Candidatus Eisenbacteria bacterium]|nr:TetR/AcrR family transcriptional regulator [Candidatus Eisenbacteria bacterium]
MGAASRTKRIPAARRIAQILDHAVVLFSQKGFDRVTMQQIARRCRVTEAALYRHFRSKDAIYEAAILSLRRRLDLPAAMAEAEKANSLGDLLTAIARTILRFHREHPEMARLLMQCSLDRHRLCSRAFRDLRAPFVRYLADRLEEMIRAGRVQAVQPQITARCFIGMVSECGLSNHLWGGIQGARYGEEESIRNNVAIYVRGLTRNRPVARRPVVARSAVPRKNANVKPPGPEGPGNRWTRLGGGKRSLDRPSSRDIEGRRQR